MCGVFEDSILAVVAPYSRGHTSPAMALPTLQERTVHCHFRKRQSNTRQLLKSILSGSGRQLAILAVFHFTVIGVAILVKCLERNAQESLLDAGYVGGEVAHVGVVA